MSTLIENAINDSNKSTLFPPLISLNLLVVSKLLLWCSAYTAVQVKKKKKKNSCSPLREFHCISLVFNRYFLTVQATHATPVLLWSRGPPGWVLEWQNVSTEETDTWTIIYARFL